MDRLDEPSSKSHMMRISPAQSRLAEEADVSQPDPTVTPKQRLPVQAPRLSGQPIIILWDTIYERIFGCQERGRIQARAGTKSMICLTPERRFARGCRFHARRSLFIYAVMHEYNISV